ncbi:hypothetical protein F6S87_00935 [Bifidobacterium sp. BRDM6]|uniref:Uncharacterized protein n=1 Tax=Bifidobacterium choloepi TaxID=2614131 RepID=A0A6I5NFT0_9BIFI|nr:hypothetical protein [Bifidobacterium choloepi]
MALLAGYIAVLGKLSVDDADDELELATHLAADRRCFGTVLSVGVSATVLTFNCISSAILASGMPRVKDPDTLLY